MFMVKEENTELQYLEQIRNLLVLQLLRSGFASNEEIAKLLKVTPGRISQIFAKTKRKASKRKKKK